MSPQEWDHTANILGNWRLFNSLSYTWHFTIYFLILFQERSSLLRKWYDLMIQNKDDLAKIITAESVSSGP